MKKKSWVKTVFNYAKPHKGKMSIAIILEVISVACGFIPYIGVYNIIMLFVEERANMDNIIPLIIICATGYVAKILFHGIATTFSHISAYNILEGIRLSMTGKLAKAPLGTVLSRPGGEIKNLIVDRVETIELPLAHIIPEGISNLLVPIGAFIYMLYIDWRLALWSLICVPLAFIVYSFVLKHFNKQYMDFMKSGDEVNSVIIEYVEGIEVIKAFGRSGSSYEKYKNSVTAFKAYTLDWFQSTWKHMTLGGAILPSSLLGALPAAVGLYLIGGITPAEIVISIALSMALVAPLTAFTVVVNDLKLIQYAINDVESILHLSELDDAKDKVDLKGYQIEFNQVDFSYNDEGSKVLNKMDLSFKEGSYTAIVGPSGSGKSTIARLIARYWDVNSGNIKIGRQNIKKIPLEQLSKTVSFVTQDNYLFHCSLMENIRIGNPEATDEEVYEAARAALCEEFILALPRGYETDAGEAGGRLSGGERQRVAIARAILKDSPVIILDEATAFTDPENEEKLQKSLMALTREKKNGKRKTLIVIAHRLSTIKEADDIVVLKEGRVLDQGSHQELLKTSEMYTNLWNAHIGAKDWSIVKNKEEVSNV